MKQQCGAWVGGIMDSRQCSRSAVRDGFCGQHHPDAERARFVKSCRESGARVAREKMRALQGT